MSRRTGLVFLLVQLVSSYQFTTDNWNSFNAYGVKLAANDLSIVEARNNHAQFVVQIAPFNTSNVSSPCYIDYPSVRTNDSNFIYSVVVPRSPDHVSIVFNGENDESSVSPGPFIGHIQVNSSCNTLLDIQSLTGLDHDEFYVIGIDPSGTMAYGFTTQFAFSYDLNTHLINQLLSWPIENFLPRAIDVDSNRIAVIAGFVGTVTSAYKPWVYMLQLNRTSSNMIDRWNYAPQTSSWQAQTFNRDADKFTMKHTMSVSIHNQTSQVLVGMPSMNIVFWFNLTTKLHLLMNRTNGAQYGFGQSVAWNDADEGPYPIILGNAYSLAYVWSSSNIFWYDAQSFLSMDAILPLFPTTTQPRWIDLSQQFISIASTTLDIAILDSLGQVYVILSTADGFYPNTNDALGFNPAFSSQSPCPAGLEKYWGDTEYCSLCTVGTMSDLDGSIRCIPYTCNETNSFCPIGSVIDDTYSDLMISISQALAYPRSPDSVIFDDILIQNMFSFSTSAECILVSPLFWTMLMTSIAALILLLMGALKFSTQSAKVRLVIKKIFRQIDLIKEGEVWIGGLASFALIVLLGFAYLFSHSYLKQYPIETSSEFSFGCDASMRNAKFESSVQSLAMPRLSEEQPIFVLLGAQQFTLTVDFVNTGLQCNDVQVIEIVHEMSKSISSTCAYNRSVLTVSVLLHSHTMSVNYVFTDVRPIGGLRVSLYGSEQKEAGDEKHDYIVRELNFSQAFFVYNRTLAPYPIIELSLTRVVNKTTPLIDNEQHNFSALWIPTSLNNISDLFVTLDQFLYYGLSQPYIRVNLSGTNEFIYNVQKPIAKSSEVIFHNLLFTIVCLELFGIGFLVTKLIFVPLFKVMHRFIAKRSNIVHPDLPTSSSKPTSIDSITNTKDQKDSVVLPIRQHAIVAAHSTGIRRSVMDNRIHTRYSRAWYIKNKVDLQ